MADDDFADAMSAAAPAAAHPAGDDFADAMTHARDPVADGPPAETYHRPVPRMARHHGVSAPDTAEAATPEPSAEHMSWGDVGRSALSNFIPSFTGQVKGMVEPFLPQNWGHDVDAAVQLARGAGSKAGIIDRGDHAKQQHDEALLNAIGDAYAKSYGTEGGFKSMLAFDPARPLTDVASVASLLAGGEGLAAKVPGVLGKAGVAAARGAGAVERATNPLSITARAVSAVLPKASAGSRAFTGPARRAFETAFPALDASEVASDPAAMAHYQTVMGQKGATPAAAREALLRRFDDPNAPTAVPTSLTTGEAPPAGAVHAVSDATWQWRQNLGNAATRLSGAAEPSSSDFGSALEQAQIARHNAYVDHYGAVASQPGAFDPAFAKALPHVIDQSLSDANLPAAANLAKYPQYATTVEAAKWLTQHVEGLAASNELTPQALMEARKGLGYFWGQARGPDEKGIGTLIEALDHHIQDSAGAGLFSGDGASVAGNMQRAISAFKRYKSDFANTSNSTHGAVASAMKSLIPDQVRDPTTGKITAPAPEGAATAAQGALGGKLINPRTLASPAGAARLHGKLTDVLGGPASDGAHALNDHIRQTVTATSPDGSLAAKPDQIHQFLDGPLAKVFSDQEQSELRQLAEAQRLVNARPTQAAREESTIKTVAGRAVRMAGASAVGHLIGGPLGHVVGGGLAEFAGEHGGILGGLAEQAAEPILGRRNASKALRGAPASRSLFLAPGHVARSVANRRGTSLAGAFYGASPAPFAVADEKAGGDSADAAELIKKAEGLRKNLRSSAEGPFQMINGTWGAEFRKMHPAETRGLTDTEVARKYRHTPEGQAVTEQMGRHVVAENTNFLKAHDIETTPRNVYMAHVFGPETALHLLRTDPATPLSNSITHADAVVKANPQFRGKTVGAVLAWSQATMDHAAAALERQPRAAGGKVGPDIDHLVTRLQNLAKRAKSESKKSTEPLLNVPDATITKALSVAQRAI